MVEKQKAGLKVIVARVVVGIMFGMLIVSFAIWGIGDIFRAGFRQRNVAEIGSVQITPQEFQEEYRRSLNRLQSMLQSEIDPQKAREMGLPQRVLHDMISRILLGLAAHDAGVAVSDEVVRQTIMSSPTFRNPQGQFDRKLFENMLYNAGYSEDRFVALTRQDLAREQVADAVTAGVVIPDLLVDTLYRYREERRVADTLSISAAAIKDIPTPSEADLEAYHKAHAQQFTAPEYRAITAVDITPEALAAGIKIPEDQIENEYAARTAEFTVPEQRSLRQILCPDEATAKRAEALLSEGQSFDKVAETVTGKPPIEIGTVKQADVGNEALAKAAFGLKEGGVSAPVQTPLGWHILQVTKITPGGTKPLAQVKDQIAKQLALRQAADAVYDTGNKLEDALGGGASLDEAAKKLGLKLLKFEAVDSNGKGPDGQPVAGLPKSSKFLPTAFASAQGRESDLVDDGNGGEFILRVDKIEPSELRPLAAVRDKVVAGWEHEARMKAAEKLAQGLADKAKGGAALADLAKQGGYTFATTTPFTRTGEGAKPALPPALVAALFAAKPGEVVSAPSLDGAMVAKLDSVTPADPAADKAGVQKLRNALASSSDSDILDSFESALERHYGVEIHEDVVNSLVGS
ncbi:MAG TPA: peptidyl-prolyl cis-trans isomerase [Alphaproteobacteria bacterium]|nr:peptidyl-prolyl cis-trans isomerase [Alphaproteobacteria bacterium]